MNIPVNFRVETMPADIRAIYDAGKRVDDALRSGDAQMMHIASAATVALIHSLPKEALFSALDALDKRVRQIMGEEATKH